MTPSGVKNAVSHRIAQGESIGYLVQAIVMLGSWVCQVPYEEGCAGDT